MLPRRCFVVVASLPQIEKETSMRKYLWLGGLSLLGLCSWTAASNADVIVRGPFGRTWVQVTPATPVSGTVVRAPGVIVQAPPPGPPPGVIVQTPPPGVIVQT